MARYPQGQPVRVSATVRDTSGNLVNAGTLTLLVKLAQADGTWATTGTYGAPVNDSTGQYHQDIPSADLQGLGHYQYTWTATGTGAGVSFGDFDVFDPFEVALLPLQDAKDMLNIPQATTTYDAEIASWVATIETSLEAMTGGPLVNRTCTERAEAVAGLTRICLRRRPVVSVTSIVPEQGGSAVSLTGVTIDANAGILQQSTGWPFYGPFWYGWPFFTVTYVAGWGTQVPAAFNSAARIILDHLWETQHGPSVRPSMGGMDVVQPAGFGFAIPSRALELMSGQINGMSIRQEAFI